MVEKVYGVDFDCHCHATLPALTLDPDCIGENESGWTIDGVIHEDYAVWVNEFEAEHPIFGRVWGNFEGSVFADNPLGFDHFWENHEPDSWDYYDI